MQRTPMPRTPLPRTTRRACSAPPPPPRLVAQTKLYGEYWGVILDPQEAGSAAIAYLPVVLLLSGSGGFDNKTKRNYGKNVDTNSLDLPLNCGKPCWYAYMQIPGSHKGELPKELIAFNKDLYFMCKHKRNPIVALGFSRGARWGEQLVRENSRYLEVAILIGGYPENRDRMKNRSHAKELVNVKTTIVCMVHFLADEHCNVSKYPDWYAEFERASQPMVRDREDITSFTNFMLHGNHDDAKKLWYNWDFAKVDDKLGSWFEAMWFHLEANQTQGIGRRIE